MEMALAERAQSDDPKAAAVAQSAVGAVIARHGEVLARSANVLPPALKAKFRAHQLPIEAGERYHLIEHAERAAIYGALLADKSTAGATIYCTRFACSDCARAIVWAGITRAVFGTGLTGEAHWLPSQRLALRILRMSGVTVRVLPTR